MKTAISLPDDLFGAMDQKARSLKLSRSALVARALREFLEREQGSSGDATEAWNRAIERGGQPGDDPAARAFARRAKAVIRGKGNRRS